MGGFVTVIVGLRPISVAITTFEKISVYSTITVFAIFTYRIR